jgi:prophage regulatory protein
MSLASQTVLLRLPAVLAKFPVSRAVWYAGIRAGKYPQPIKLGVRASAWKASDIDALIQSLSK